MLVESKFKAHAIPVKINGQYVRFGPHNNFEMEISDKYYSDVRQDNRLIIKDKTSDSDNFEKECLLQKIKELKEDLFKSNQQIAAMSSKRKSPGRPRSIIKQEEDKIND